MKPRLAIRFFSFHFLCFVSHGSMMGKTIHCSKKKKDTPPQQQQPRTGYENTRMTHSERGLLHVCRTSSPRSTVQDNSQVEEKKRILTVYSACHGAENTLLHTHLQLSSCITSPCMLFPSSLPHSAFLCACSSSHVLCCSHNTICRLTSIHPRAHTQFLSTMDTTMLATILQFHKPSYALTVSVPACRLLVEADSQGDEDDIRDGVLTVRKYESLQGRPAGVKIRQCSANVEMAQRVLDASLWWLRRPPLSLSHLPVTLAVNSDSPGLVHVQGGDVVALDIISPSSGDTAPQSDCVDFMRAITVLQRLVVLSVSSAPGHENPPRILQNVWLLHRCDNLRRLYLSNVAFPDVSFVPLRTLQVLHIVDCDTVVDFGYFVEAYFLFELRVVNTCVCHVDALCCCMEFRTTVLENCTHVDTQPIQAYHSTRSTARECRLNASVVRHTCVNQRSRPHP